MILFPQAASTIAPRVDSLALALTTMSLALSAAIAGTIVALCVRYREGADVDRSEPPASGSRVLEAVWIGVPTVVGLAIFAWGALIFVRMRRPPPDALVIRVIGKQWMWQVQHAQGRREINELHVPIGRPVELSMTSQDVIHSFYVPEFRVKQDVLPDRVTTLWFQATREGVYQLACAQYCGAAHAHMRGRVVAMTERDYGRWLAGGAEAPLSAAARGAALFERESCAACHARAGGKGPPLARIAGRAVRLASGAVVLSDDSYLRESILDPGAKLVEGYANIMPSFRGRLTEPQLADLLEYLHALGRGREAAR